MMRTIKQEEKIPNLLLPFLALETPLLVGAVKIIVHVTVYLFL